MIDSNTMWFTWMSTDKTDYETKYITIIYVITSLLNTKQDYYWN